MTDSCRYSATLLRSRSRPASKKALYSAHRTHAVRHKSPLVQVGFGEEYITDLAFDAGNLTLFTEVVAPPPPPV